MKKSPASNRGSKSSGTNSTSRRGSATGGSGRTASNSRTERSEK